MKYLIISIIVLELIAVGCSDKASVIDIDKQEESEYTPIEEIWASTEKYRNQMVSLRGQYRGWHGEGIKNPLITRSDWVIKDDTGSIYVTGRSALRLRPERDIGIEIVVRGQVLLNKDMVPYVKVAEVIRVIDE